MAEFDYKKMAERVVEYALNNVLYNGKSIREWVKLIMLAQESCEDAVDRKEAIRILDEGWKHNRYPRGAILSMSAVWPVRKTGRWIKHSNHQLGICMSESYECSECGKYVGCQYFSRRLYCPNCGSYNGGE